MLKDVQILRRLARSYAEAAAQERNTENCRLHRAVNDLQMIRVNGSLVGAILGAVIYLVMYAVKGGV